MEFGKVHDPYHLDQINWKLPPEDALTRSFLQKKGLTRTQLWVGSPTFAHKEWLGKIYPLKTKTADYLYHYSRYFNTIEFNTTHYRIPTPEQTEKWCEQVPSEFLFCPKIFQGISHDHAGLIDPHLLKSWLEFLENVKDHCGPCFLQLPPHFDYSWKVLLFKFLQAWPSDYQIAIEFRHPTWFQNGAILPALTQYLQSRNIGLVMTDVAGRRDVLHSSISADFTMIRFIGNEIHTTDFSRAHAWNEQLLNWEKQGLAEVFFFIHEPDDTFVPEMARHLKTLSFFQRAPLTLNHE